ncbi:rod shape-determining protein MreC [Candidatus Poribacteria bacterium]|nr:rod shape-determining protein MreC [Candidatus Poribacteria bacterium]
MIPGIVTKSNRKYFLLVFFLFIAFILIITHGSNPPRSNLVKKLGIWMITPFRKLATDIGQWAGGIYGDIKELGSLKTENIKLKKQVDSYLLKESVFNEMILENKRLRKILQFKENYYEYELLPAEIIGKDPTNWFNTILINRGSYDGVKEKMPVITPHGLVGKVIEVTKYVSRVQLILDMNSAVGAMVQRNRSIGILRGFSREVCELDYLSRTLDIREGDIVVTSGLGGVFPKGLPIGKVSKIEKKNYGLMQRVIVVPLINFYNIEEIMIVKNPDVKTEDIDTGAE